MAVQNKEQESSDLYPLSETPLNILLAETIDLTNDVKVVEVSRRAGILVIKLVDADDPEQGSLTLYFSDPVLRLKQWTVVDAAQLETTVRIQNLRNVDRLDPELFMIKDLSATASGGD